MQMEFYALLPHSSSNTFVPFVFFVVENIRRTCVKGVMLFMPPK